MLTQTSVRLRTTWVYTCTKYCCYSFFDGGITLWTVEGIVLFSRAWNGQKKKKKERQTRCPTGPGHDTKLPTRGSFSLSMTLVLHYLQRYGSPDWSLPRLRHRVPSSLSLSLHPRSTPPIDSRYTYHFLSIDVDLNSRPSCLFPSTATLPVNRHLIPPVWRSDSVLRRQPATTSASTARGRGEI
jgi:hypothetical protein